MTTTEAIAAIAAIPTSDPGAAHGALDDILLDLVPAGVRAAVVAKVRECPEGWSR